MNISSEDWRIWEKRKLDGELHYKRAIGKEAEMESSKAICSLLNEFYSPEMTLLDVGCGGGHYLKSLRARVDSHIRYKGVDATASYIELAKKAYQDENLFKVGDILNLDFPDSKFDIVMCNNLILHLPPPPKTAISELIRVAKDKIIIRTLFGKRNYIIKQLYSSEEVESESFNEIDIIGENGSTPTGNYYNIYTENYILETVKNIAPNAKVEIRKDDNWQAFNNCKKAGSTGTKAVNGYQISGNIVLDWRFLIISK